MIQMAITLITISGVSFRSVSKIFLAMKITFNLSIKVPSHTTVLNWVKKQGVANFREKEFFDNQKWVLIMDESIQFGNKKLLAIMAVPVSAHNKEEALNYNDLVPILLKSSESWKAEDIARELRACINLEQVQYVISDNGNNLKSSYELLGIKHIEDVGHKFSWIIKEVYEKQPDFEAYTKELAKLRGKSAMSKYSHIIPPTQRIVSRFMNLTPLFKWGYRMLQIIEKGKLTSDEFEKVKFVLDYKELIQQSYILLETLNKIQKILKINGFTLKTVEKCKKELEKLQDERTQKVRQMICKYFADTISKMGGEKKLLCSSDIIESCFGKYKSVVKANKTVGITDLCLCISTLLASNDLETLKHNMYKVKMSDVKEWKDKNIGETLFEKRNVFYKNAG